MAAICDIYADEVVHGVSSWEEVPPSVDELTRRRDALLTSGFPYRVIHLHDKVAGYAYASSYRPRPGYRYTVENSIYVAREARGQGVGRQLLEDLVTQCEVRGYRQMIAVVGDSNNLASINFHMHLCFTRVGLIQSIGFKFGRWMDSVILQRPLGDGDQRLPD